MVKRLSKAIQPPHGPSYCHHRASGQAYVKVRGKVTYLGVYGSEASRDAYASAVAAILGGQEVPSLSKGKPNELPRLTVREVGDRLSFYAATYYVKNGKSTAEAGMVATACNRASAMFGDQLAEAFGPLALKSVRSHLVEMGLARSTINGSVRRIRRAFKWAAGEELIPASIPQALATVEGLRAGRSAAREPAPVLPVDDATVEATLTALPTVVADMARLQRLTRGCVPARCATYAPATLTARVRSGPTGLSRTRPNTTDAKE